jgi:hypothetical protein
MTPTPSAPGSAWRALVRKNGTAEFAAAFSRTVSLETSVMNERCIGVELVGAFFAATTTMYDRLDFTYETVAGRRTFFEWEGAAFGFDIAGTTIITRNEAGLIDSIRLYHRPLHQIVRFSTELAQRLEGKVDRRMFGA